MPTSTPRPYRSTLRSEQATATRDRVVDAAGRLFSDRGFAGTTLASIAASAEVSIETVQAQGPKRQLLGAALRRATLGREGDESIVEAPEARAIAEAGTPHEFSHAVADLLVGFNARTAGIWRAFGSAAADDPVVDAEWSEVMAAVRRNVAEVIEIAQTRGWVRSDLPIDELVASAWILVGSESFEKLTGRLGWSSEQYRNWLARSLQELLFV